MVDKINTERKKSIKNPDEMQDLTITPPNMMEEELVD
jgi:hypothetical protein